MQKISTGEWYNNWVAAQFKALTEAYDQRVREGVFGDAIWLIPTDGRNAGRLVLASEKPEGSTDVVRFPGGVGMSATPRAALQGLLWQVCRRFPIIPTELP